MRGIEKLREFKFRQELRYKKDIEQKIKDMTEPYQTILRLYADFLHCNKKRLFKQNLIIEDHFKKALEDIEKCEITLDLEVIKENYNKFGVLQLRPLSNDTLIVGCGDNCHEHPGADTIDSNLLMNPIVVGYYGDEKNMGIFSIRERYQLIIDEGPLRMLSDLHSKQELNLDYTKAINQTLVEANGVVVTRAAEPYCVEVADEESQHRTDRSTNKAEFPAHVHISACPPEKGGPPKGYYFFGEEITFLSPEGEPFLPRYFDYEECKERNLPESLKAVFRKLEDIQYPYLRAGSNIYVKDKSMLPEELTCPYSQNQDVFIRQANKRNFTL